MPFQSVFTIVFLLRLVRISTTVRANTVFRTHPENCRTCGVGRSAEGHVGASPTGTSATYTFGYGQGMYLGASFDGEVVKPRHAINAAFYGEGRSDPSGIVNGTIPFPVGKMTEVDSLKEKLTLCAQWGKRTDDRKTPSGGAPVASPPRRRPPPPPTAGVVASPPPPLAVANHAAAPRAIGSRRPSPPASSLKPTSKTPRTRPESPLSDSPHADRIVVVVPCSTAAVVDSAARSGPQQHLIRRARELGAAAGPWRNNRNKLRSSPAAGAAAAGGGAAAFAAHQQENELEDVLERMMLRERELLLPSEQRGVKLQQLQQQQGRDDSCVEQQGDEEEDNLRQRRGDAPRGCLGRLVTSSLIVHVEPDWQSTRQL
jgi:Las17-binding protein actin regulator